MIMKPFAENRKAYFDYEILRKFEAGLALLGTEVKSIQKGQGDLAGAAVLVRGNKAFLINADIPAYQSKNAPVNYNQTRSRQLLLNKHELKELSEISKEKKLTIVPLSLYNKGHRIKLLIAIARQRKKSDKREAIRKREAKRQIRRAVK